MKKIYSLLAVLLFAGSIQAQDSFEYSLSYLSTEATGAIRVAIMATPNFTEAGGNTADQGIILDMSDNVYVSSTLVNDCVTGGPPTFTRNCTYDTAPGNGNTFAGTEWGATFIVDGGIPAGRYVYQLIRTEGAITVLFDAVAATPIVFAVVDLLPTAGGTTPVSTGDLTFVANGTYASTSNYMNISYPSSGGTVNYMKDGAAAAPIGTVNFASLSTAEVELRGVSIFPNPATDVVTINGLDNELTKVEVYNIGGQRVLETTTNMEAINVAALQTGVYFVKVYTETASKTVKLVKK